MRKIKIYSGKTQLKSGGSIRLAVKELHNHSARYSEDLGTFLNERSMGQSSKVSYKETEISGDISIQANGGLSVELESSGSLRSKLGNLANEQNIRTYTDKSKTSYTSQTELTGISKMIITAAVAAVTAGAGSGAVAAMSGTSASGFSTAQVIAASAIQGAATNMASGLAINLIEKGDVGAAFAATLSAKSLGNAAIAALSGGLTAGIGSVTGFGNISSDMGTFARLQAIVI